MATARTEITDTRRMGLTLADLEAVCAQARSAGGDGSEIVSGRLSWKGTLTGVSVAVQTVKATREDIR